MNLPRTQNTKTLRSVLPLGIVLIALLAACDTASDPAAPTEDPSTITLEAIQTVGDLSGGVFDGPFTLTRTVREYTPDGEDDVTGMLYELPEGEIVTDIYGFARDDHPVIDQFHIRVPATTTGTYEYDPDTDTPENLWLRLETNYGVWLAAGYDWAADSELSVTITELSDRWIVGSVTADLIYFDVEEVDGGGTSRTIDTEISYTNVPVLNGSFRIYRDRTNGL